MAAEELVGHKPRHKWLKPQLAWPAAKGSTPLPPAPSLACRAPRESCALPARAAGALHAESQHPTATCA